MSAVCLRCRREWPLKDCVTYSCVDVFSGSGPGFFSDGYLCSECASKLIAFIKGADE